MKEVAVREHGTLAPEACHLKEQRMVHPGRSDRSRPPSHCPSPGSATYTLVAVQPSVGPAHRPCSSQIGRYSDRGCCRWTVPILRTSGYDRVSGVMG
jgi:hypothetical protein